MMTQKRYTALLLVVLLSISVVFTGCGKTASAPAIQEVRINLGAEPAQLDPQLASDVVPMTVINMIFEGLCRKSEKGMPEAGIAEKWDINQDQSVYTFHLRDAKWADGTPVTADDFKNAWIRALDPKPTYSEPSRMAQLLFYIKGAEEFNAGKGKVEDLGIRVKDPKTLVVTLTQPTPFFLDITCNSVYMPVNKAFYDKQPIKDKVTRYGTEAQMILGNGPFLVKEWNHDNSIVVTKNDAYWRKDEIKLDRIVYKMIKDDAASFNAFKAGEVDMVGLSSERIEECKKLGYDVKTYDRGTTVYIDYNQKDKLLGNVSIRKALAYSLDRETFVNKVVKDGSERALGFVNPAIYGDRNYFRLEAGDTFKDNNVEEAKALLKKGLQEMALSSPPKLTLLIDDTAIARRDAQVYQDMWKKNLNLEVDISPMPFDAMLNKMFGGDYQMALMSWGADYNHPLGFLENYVLDNPNNLSGYHNPKYDEWIHKSKSETGSSAAMTDLINAEKQLMDDMALCPLYFNKSSFVVNSRVKGLVRRSSAVQDIDLFRAYVSVSE